MQLGLERVERVDEAMVHHGVARAMLAHFLDAREPIELEPREVPEHVCQHGLHGRDDIRGHGFERAIQICVRNRHGST